MKILIALLLISNACFGQARKSFMQSKAVGGKYYLDPQGGDHYILSFNSTKEVHAYANGRGYFYSMQKTSKIPANRRFIFEKSDKIEVRKGVLSTNYGDQFDNLKCSVVDSFGLILMDVTYKDGITQRTVVIKDSKDDNPIGLEIYYSRHGAVLGFVPDKLALK